MDVPSRERRLICHGGAMARVVVTALACKVIPLRRVLKLCELHLRARSQQEKDTHDDNQEFAPFADLCGLAEECERAGR